MKIHWNVDWLFQSFWGRVLARKSLFYLYYHFYFYLFQCFGSRLGLLVCKITLLGFSSTLLATLFTPSGKYLFVSTQQIHWSCLVILLTFIYIFDSLHFYPLGVSSPNTPPPAVGKNYLNLNEMKTFTEKREQKNHCQKWGLSTTSSDETNHPNS